MRPVVFFNVKTEQRITCTSRCAVRRFFDNRDPRVWICWEASPAEMRGWRQ